MYKASANILIACSFLWLTACSSAGVVTEDLIPTDYVNPFIGASTSVGAAGVYHGLGKTLPGQARQRVDGQALPLPGPDRGPGHPRGVPRPAPRLLRRRYHLRHQQRVRLRLPA